MPLSAEWIPYENGWYRKSKALLFPEYENSGFTFRIVDNEKDPPERDPEEGEKYRLEAELGLRSFIAGWPVHTPEEGEKAAIYAITQHKDFYQNILAELEDTE